MNPWETMLAALTQPREGVKRRSDVAANRAERKALIRDEAEGLLSRRERVRAFRQPSVEERKRTSVLLPSARELFAIRPRPVQADGTRATAPWPRFDTAEQRDAYVHARLLEAGLR